MVDELVGTMNKEVVMVHYGQLELWVEKKINTDIFRLKYFYRTFVKKISAMMIAGLFNRI